MDSILLFAGSTPSLLWKFFPALVALAFVLYGLVRRLVPGADLRDEHPNRDKPVASSSPDHGAASREPGPLHGNVAVLLIHGIGEQQPYETIDGFARGLADYFRRQQCDVGLAAKAFPHENWTELAVELAIRREGQEQGRITVHEYYWTPYCEGKIKYAEVLAWMARTALSPIERFRRHLAAEAAAEGSTVGEGRTAFLFFRELLRTITIPLLFLALTLWVVLVIRQPNWSAVASLSLPGLAAGFGQAVRHPLAVLEWAANLAAWAGMHRVLVGYLGDVALYTNADRRARSYAVRNSILTGAVDALRQLLQRAHGGGYDRVILAAHSLGTVVALDAIDRLRAEAQSAEQTAVLNCLTGLITFGSPLDEVLYFFQQEAGQVQAIRTQLVNWLHSFRRARSGNDYRPYQLMDYSYRTAPELWWMNLYCPLDPVGPAPLKFYRPNEQVELRGPWLWGYAHVQYTAEASLYQHIGERYFALGARAAG